MDMITIDDVTIAVTRKRIKNMYIHVEPDGSVTMSAPKWIGQLEMETFAHSHYGWIRKQQIAFSKRPKDPEPQYLSGEVIFLWGEAYHLEVVSSGVNSVSLLGDKIILQVRGTTSLAGREAVLDGWYRTQLEAALPAVIERCEAIVGVHAAEWRIKKMKTRWGTCNIIKKRIWINLQLAKKTPDCLDYIVTHELTHLWERGHNARFKAFMDRFYPDWRAVRKELNMQAD